MGTRRDSRVLVEFGHAIAAHDGGTMENTPNNNNPKNDVLQSDHHSALTAEAIAKALEHQTGNTRATVTRRFSRRL